MEAEAAEDSRLQEEEEARLRIVAEAAEDSSLEQQEEEERVRIEAAAAFTKEDWSSTKSASRVRMFTIEAEAAKTARQQEDARACIE